MDGFFVCFSQILSPGKLGFGEDARHGWRVAWSHYIHGFRFARKIDAEAAVAALIRAGLSPEDLDLADDDPRWNRINRIMLESLQW